MYFQSMMSFQLMLFGFLDIADEQAQNSEVFQTWDIHLYVIYDQLKATLILVNSQ